MKVAGRVDTSRLRGALTNVIRRALPLETRQEILVRRAEPVVELLKDKAPKYSGRSADAIGVEVMDGDGSEAVIAIGVGKEGFALDFYERGRHNQPARPFMRPTWEGEADAYRAGVAQDVKAAIGGKS